MKVIREEDAFHARIVMVSIHKNETEVASRGGENFLDSPRVQHVIIRE
jgi:hypothetical protein